MADNTRKTSNIIHEVADLNSTVNNLAQNIENNTESIGNIKVYDSHIWLSTSKGLTVTQDGNTTTNNDQPTEWKLEADTDYLNTTLNFAKSDDIPSVYVKDIKSGDITTLTVSEEDGVYTLTALGGGGGGGIENITLAEGTCIKIDSEQYDDNGTTKTRLTINTDTDCLNDTLDFAKPDDIGDGAINLTGGTGIDVTGANATANQTGNTSWSVAIDDTVALKSEIPSNIVETLNNLTGNLTLESSDSTIGIADNGTDKINLTLNANLSDLSDVSSQDPANDQILTYNGTSNTWEPAASQSGGVTTLAALDDTNVSTPTEGQTLVWNNTDSKWENKDASGGVSNLPISSTDGNVILDGESNTFTVKTNKTDQLTVDSQGRIQFQSTSGGNVLGDSDFSTYLQFNNPAGEAYKNKNIMLRAGQSYVVVNSDATVRLVNNAKLKGAADDAAELAFPSSGAATISTGGSERVRVTDDKTTISGVDTIPLEVFSGGASCSMVFNRNGNANRWSVGADNEGFAMYRGPGVGDKAFTIDELKNATFYGQVQTDTITTKDAADKDVSMSLGGQFIYVESGDDNVYTFNSNNHFIVGSKNSNVNANRAGIEIHDTEYPELIFSMDADASAASTVALRRAGSSFYINAQAVGDDVKIATGNVVRLTVSDNDIAAFDGYEPQTENSLVTKGWVQANGASGNLPLSSEDGTVVLDSPSADTFTISVGGSEEFAVNSLGDFAFGVGQFYPSRFTIGHPFVDDPRDSTIRLYTTQTKTNDFINIDLSRGSNIVGNFGHKIDVASSGNEETSFCVNVADGNGGLEEVISAGKEFTISTGGEERVKVDANGNVLIGTNDSTARWQEIRHSTVPAYTTNSLVEGMVAEATFSINAHPVSEGSESWLRSGNANYADAAIRIQSGSFTIGSQILFATSPNKDASAPITRLIVDKDGDVIVNGGDIITSRIVGPAANDASIELGAIATIDAASGLVVKTSGHGTARLYVQDNYSQFNGRLWVSSGTAAAPGLTGPNAATGLCLGEDNEEVISASINGVSVMSLQANENAFIQVATIKGSKAPATDASIELGFGFVVVVGGVQRIIATASTLTQDFPQLDLKNTGSETSTELFFGGSAKDVATFARFGKIQGRLSDEAVASGQYEGELCFWSQIGSPPYYRTNPDIQIKTDGSVAFNNGDVLTSRIAGPAANDASIELGATATIQTEANNAFIVNPTGSAYGVLHTPKGNSSAGQAVRPFLTSVHSSNTYNVRMTDWSYLTIDLLSGDPASPYKLSDYQAHAFNGKVDHYSGFTVGGFDPASMQATQAFGAYINVNAALDGREFYAIYCDGTAPSYFSGDVQTSRIVGAAAPDTDASIELGADATISTGGEERLKVSEPETVIASRYVKQSPTAGKFSQHQWTAIDDTVLSTITQYNADYGLASTLDVGPLGLAIESPANVGVKFASNKSFIVGNNIPRLTVDVHKIRCDVPVEVAKIVGKTDPATDASIEIGAELLTSNHTPTQPNSIATKQYVDDSFSGGGVDEDTVPGSGANFRWNEKLISVPYRINEVIQSNRQIFSQLYAYDGIFTDGLHWTTDGYSWHTSDQSINTGQLSNYVEYDLGRVCKGNGNEYVTAKYISNDMKSWRRINGLTTAGQGAVYLAGEIYGSDCSYKLNRETTTWESTGYSAAIGGDLTSTPNVKVASMESGLYAVVLSADDGTAYWTVALDGEPVPYRAIGNGITGGISICFSERLQKWMIASDDTFWISDDANVAATNWTSMSLPTAANWDRMVDDGGTISIASTDDNSNIVLYCQAPDGPAVTSDWQTTTLYNNRGYDGFCGTNGRTIGSMKFEGIRTDPETNDQFSDYYYAISGDVRLENTTDTSQIQLVSPTRDLRDLSPPTGLKTQSDANQFMAAEIAKRAIVVTLTQAEYDALSPPDENTLYLIT